MEEVTTPSELDRQQAAANELFDQPQQQEPELKWSQLLGIPSSWVLIPVGEDKVPIDPANGEPMAGWNTQAGYDVESLSALNGTCAAAGVLHGPRSGGLVVVDMDGPKARAAFQNRYQRDVVALPKTLSWSSGRPGRYQLGYQVPESEWDRLKGKAGWKASGNEDAKANDIELFWNLQSVIAGHHPNDKGDGQGFYAWREGWGPKEVELAVAPDWLLEPLLKKESTEPKEPREITESDYEDVERAKTILDEALDPQNFEAHDDWLKVAMSCHYVGWVVDEPEALLPSFIGWCSSMSNFDEGEIERSWARWTERGKEEGFNMGTLVNLAKEAGWVEENPLSHDLLYERVSKKLSFIERGFLNSLRSRGDSWQQKYQKLVGQTAKDEEETLQEARQLVEEIKKFYASIRRLDEPAQRTAAWERFCRKFHIKKTQLQAIVKEIVEADNQDNKQFYDFDTLMAGNLGAEPLVEDFLPRGRVTLIAADGGGSKSTLMYQLCAAVSSGSKFLDMFVAAMASVLFFQNDEPASDAQTKLRTMDLSDQLSGNPNFRIQWAFTPGMLPDLEEAIVSGNRSLVVLDSFTSIFAGGENSINDPEVALHVYELQKIASRTNCAIVLTHHLNRGSMTKSKTRSDVTSHDLFGSSYIFNAVSDAWGIWKTEEGTSQNPRYRMKKLKNRSLLCQDGQVYDLEGCTETLRHQLVDKVGDDSVVLAKTLKEAVQVYLRANKGKFFSAELLATKLATQNKRFLSASADTVRKVLTKLYSQANRTQVTRRKQPLDGPGRRGFEYGIE